jgi:hypothetical protein
VIELANTGSARALAIVDWPRSNESLSGSIDGSNRRFGGDNNSLKMRCLSRWQ